MENYLQKNVSKMQIVLLFFGILLFFTGNPTLSVDAKGKQLKEFAIVCGQKEFVLGNTYQLTAWGTYDDEDEIQKINDVTWETSNKWVCSVDEDGIASAGKTGSAVITAIAPDGSIAKKTIKVTEGMVIVIDPGHGGRDSGAVNSSKKLIERNINLQIAKACKKELEKYSGVKVYLTRTSNSYYPSLKSRPRLAKTKKADLFLSMHINDGAKSAKGAEVYQSVKSAYKNTTLARNILSELKKLGISSRGVKTRKGNSGDYYAVIRGAAAYKICGMIIEHGFIRNSHDAGKMNSITKQKKLGVADAKAVAKTFNLSKKLSDGHLNDTAVIYADSISVPKETTLNINQRKKIEATVLPSNASLKELTWTSSDPSIVTVDSDGNAYGVSEGTAYIDVSSTDGTNIKERVKITVNRYITSLSVSKTKITLKKGKKHQISSSIKPVNATNKKLKYTTSKKSVATVSKSGLIYAKKKGIAVIKVKATDGSGKSKSIQVKVK